MNSLTLTSIVDTMKTTTAKFLEKVSHEETKSSLTAMYNTQLSVAAAWASEIDKVNATIASSFTKMAKGM